MQSDNSNEKKPATSSQNSSESPSDDLITLNVKNLRGQTRTIIISKNATIQDLYYAAIEKEYNPDIYSEFESSFDEEKIHNIRLIFAGKQLDQENENLTYYNISNESTLHLVLRLPGKPLHTLIICEMNNLIVKIKYREPILYSTIKEELRMIIGAECISLNLQKKQAKEGESEYVAFAEEWPKLIGKKVFAKFDIETSKKKIISNLTAIRENGNSLISNKVAEIQYIKLENSEIYQQSEKLSPNMEEEYGCVSIKLSTQTLILNGAMIGGGGALCACLTLSHKFPKHPNHVLLTEAVTSALAGAVAGGLLTYVAGLLYNYFTQLPERQNGHDRSQ